MKKQGSILSARAWIMTTLAVALLAMPVTTQAQQPEAGGDKPAAGEDSNQAEYDALIEIATERYAEKDYEGAIAAFKKAYETQPSEPNILYNIGRLYEKTGDFESAIDYYERFVNEPDIDIDARQDAVARIKTLREVLKMREEKEKPADKEKPEEKEKLEETDKTVVVTPPQPEPTPERKLGLPITFLALGGASLAAGGAFTYLTNQSSQAAEDATTLEDLRTANDQGTTRALLADSFFVAGGVLAAVGVVFLVRSGSSDSEGKAQLSPILDRNGAGMGLTVSF